jgi:hypothetical protein
VGMVVKFELAAQMYRHYGLDGNGVCLS